MISICIAWGELVASHNHKNIEEIVVTKKPLGSEMTHRLSEDTLIGHFKLKLCQKEKKKKP